MESGLAEAEERRSPRARSPAREASVESAPHHEPLRVAGVPPRSDLGLAPEQDHASGITRSSPVVPVALEAPLADGGQVAAAAPSAPSGRAPPLSPRAPGPNGGSSPSRRGRSPRASPHRREQSPAPRAGSPRQSPVRRHASPACPDDGAAGPQPPVLPARRAAPPANRSRSSHGGRGRGRGWRGWNGSPGRGSYHTGPAQSSLERALQSLPSVLEGALTRAFSAAPHPAPTLDPSRSRLPGSSAAAALGGPRVAGEAVAVASTVRPRLLRNFPTAHEGGHRSSRRLVVASMQARNRADPGPPTVTTAKVLLQGSPSGSYIDRAGEACLQHAAEIAALVGPVLDAPARGGAVASTLFLSDLLLRAHISSSRAQIYSSRAQIYSSRAQIYSSRAQIYSSRAQIYSSRAQIYSSRAQIYSSRPQIYSSRAQIYSSRAQIYSSRAQIYSSRAQIYSSRAQISSSRAQIYSSRAQIYSSRAQIYSSRAQIYSSRAHISSS
ncbi:unnamed protein product [Closterium sp. Naga37s-1]|nr:unnamed protein product [Closterium sp. Naga37s-1]